MMIWAIFGLPGPPGGSGGPMWGLGGSAETKFSNFRMDYFLPWGPNGGPRDQKKAVLGQNRLYAKVNFSQKHPLKYGSNRTKMTLKDHY